jgi:hypothetical protein
MAQTNDWGDSPAVVENPADWGDKPAAQRELPAGVKPSSAGGGRGTVNPPAVETPPEVDEVFDPMTGAKVGEVPHDPRSDIKLSDAKRTKYKGRVLDADIPPMTPASLAQDAAAGALQIGPTVVKGVGDLVRLGTLDNAGKGITDFAERGNKAIQQVVGSDRAAAQRTRFEQDMQDPALNAGEVIVGNPGALADQVLPTVGSMALPMGAAKIANVLATGSRAAKVAAAIDPATVAARAATVGDAAVVGTTIAQNAGDTFGTVRDAGGTPAEAVTAAAITAPFTYIASRLTGGGAEGQVARSMAGRAAHNGAMALPKAVIKEAGQETGEQVGQSIGETVGAGEPLDLNKASKEVAVSGTLGGVIGGGAHAVSARIDKLKAAGETEAASFLQRQLDTHTAGAELQAMGEAAAHPKFQEAYRAQRTAGLKPAEAAARAGMQTGFDEIAEGMGLSQAAREAVREKTTKMPLDKVPGFLERYVATFAEKGLAQPMPAGAVESTIHALRDDAMGAAMDGVYSDSPKTTADAITDLEKKAEPFDAGNDVIVTPEHDQVHQAATSPLSAIPEPTEAQKDAGNYKVGRMKIAGLDVSIENPQGSVRKGVSQDGKAWESPMRDHYGYIRGTVGADKDHLDVFVKPGTPESYAGPVYVVDQVDPKTGAFDEHKVVFGAGSEAEAREQYLRNYDKGWNGLGAITEMPMDAFKDWARSGKLKAPLDASVAHVKESASAKAEETQGQAPAAEQGAAGSGEAAGPDPRADPARADGGEGSAAVEQLGRDFESLDQGGKPFKHEGDARNARKKVPHMRVVRVEGGFALSPKTAVQLAAEERAARRLSLPQTGTKGMPIPVHAFVADAGGLSQDTKSEIGIDTNVRIGNRTLFAAKGKGLTLAQASELLHQHHYIAEEGEDHAIEAIQKSLRTPQYNPEGWQRLAEVESATRFEDYLKAEQEHEDSLVPLDGEYTSGVTDKLTPEQEDEMRSLIAAAEAEGVDTEAVLERAAIKAQNGDSHDYFLEARSSLQAAPGPVGQGTDRGEGAGQGRQEAEPASAGRGGEVPGEQGAPRSEQAPVDRAEQAQSPRSGRELIVETRKRESVLKSLRLCLGAR